MTPQPQAPEFPPPGGTGAGAGAGTGSVVAEASADFAETFPAASTAATAYEYAVDGDRPESVNDAAVDVPTCVPPRKMR